MAPVTRRRRVTLGVVNGNRRESMGNELIDQGSKKRGNNNSSSNNNSGKSKSRMSMLPRFTSIDENSATTNNTTTNNKSRKSPSRRKSAGAGITENRRQSSIPPPTAQVKSDPRPITDKTHINSCVRSLMHYLTKSGYDYSITHKTLLRPSGRDFNQIVTFLLRKVDLTFQADGTTLKFEDEVAIAFKSLGYPYPISKTALVAAGSPHTWPTLLSALTWLIELLECHECEVEAEESARSKKAYETLEELENKADQAFFRFLGEAYQHFLAGDDETSEKLREGLVDEYEEDNMIIEHEVEKVAQANQDIEEEIVTLARTGEILPELQKKREEYESELEHYYGLREQMDEHKQELLKKVHERTEQLETIEREIKDLDLRLNSTKQTLSSQEISVNDVRRMETERTRAKDTVEGIQATKEENSKSLWELETELAQLIEGLEVATSNFHAATKAGDLLLEEECADDNVSADKPMFQITINKDKAHENDQSLLLGGIKMQSMVTPAFDDLHTKYKEKATKARKDLLSALDQKESSEESATEALDAKKIVVNKNKKTEEAFEREKEEQEGALDVRLREIQAIETKIGDIRDPVAVEEAMARYQRQCVELEALRRDHNEFFLARRRAIKEEIHAALALCVEHKEYQQQQLAELERYALSQQQNCLNTVVQKPTISEH